MRKLQFLYLAKLYSLVNFLQYVHHPDNKLYFFELQFAIDQAIGRITHLWNK
ncbi:unnamed protein product [Schistosoma curassoni]|uniref:Four helix bundle protein n=1 Tax=Schistosoma curassoni TaxID=6186 RepID=A0A183L4R3_9TREM|nr:unnamed protein product [Schistosoma curassoni]